jgi:flagellar biosynthesis protein FlhF
MNIRRFFGNNSREALNMVRSALGDDAVILSNRSMNGGNEIMAFKEEDMQAMLIDGAEQSFNTSNQLSLLESIRQRKQLTEDRPLSVNANEHNINARQANPTKNTEINHPQLNDMLTEMREMRSVLESQLTTIAWGNIQQRSPIKSEMLSRLLHAGFSATLSRQLTENLQSNLDRQQAMAAIKSILAKNIVTLESETEILDNGGIFALIGPTGVGKTTTTAKLAARYVMKHGTEKLGLITTDSYRIGGHEQLRIYGKILGVMVHTVKDEDDLKIALNELKGKHTILIDTVGVGQRDSRVAEQISMLANSNSRIKRLLCLNATSNGETLADVISAYKGNGLDGCIMTKVDEAATVGNVLDLIVRQKIKLYYTTDGQRVPEDIHLADKEQLIADALKHSAISHLAFQFSDAELPFVMGNTTHVGYIAPSAEVNYA